MSESDPFHPNGPALDVDGKLVNRLARVEPPQAPGPSEAEEPLELPEPQPKRYEASTDAYREAPPVAPSRRTAWWVFGAVLVLGGALLTAVLKVPLSSWPPPVRAFFGCNAFLDGLAHGDRASVVVTSEPSGATVRIAGAVVGTTPWAGDNLWGDTTVSVELPGHATFSAPIKAYTDATIDARLRAR